MGVAASVVGELGAEVIAEGVAEGVAESTAEAAAEGVGDAAAEAAAKGIADATAEAAAEGVTEAAVEAAAEDAAGDAASGVVEEAIEKSLLEAAKKGLKQAALKIISVGAKIAWYAGIIEGTLKLNEIFEDVAEGKAINKLLGKLKDALKDSKEQVKNWMGQIEVAKSKGNLKGTVNVGPVSLDKVDLLSDQLTKASSDFTDSLDKKMAVLSTLANKKPTPGIEELKKSVQGVTGAFILHGGEYIEAVQLIANNEWYKGSGIDYNLQHIQGLIDDVTANQI